MREGGGGRLVLTAYGYDVCLHPFVIRDEVPLPARLTRRRRTGLGQGRFHSTPADLDEWVFPPDATWFGCLVRLQEEGAPAVTPTIGWAESGPVITVSSDGGPTVRLFRQPAGGVTELYEDDWRTQPLLECPTGTLWPGELARLATHAAHR